MSQTLLTIRCSRRVSLNGHGYAIVPSHLRDYPNRHGQRIHNRVENEMLGRSGDDPARCPTPDRVPGFLLQLPKGREGWLVARRVRVARRGLAVLAWTLPAMLIQAAVPDFAGAREGRVRSPLLGDIRPPDRDQGPGHRHTGRRQRAGRRWSMCRTTPHGSMSRWSAGCSTGVSSPKAMSRPGRSSARSRAWGGQCSSPARELPRARNAIRCARAEGRR